MKQMIWSSYDLLDETAKEMCIRDSRYVWWWHVYTGFFYINYP